MTTAILVFGLIVLVWVAQSLAAAQKRVEALEERLEELESETDTAPDEEDDVDTVEEGYLADGASLDDLLKALDVAAQVLTEEARPKRSIRNIRRIQHLLRGLDPDEVEVLMIADP